MYVNINRSTRNITPSNKRSIRGRREQEGKSVVQAAGGKRKQVKQEQRSSVAQRSTAHRMEWTGMNWDEMRWDEMKWDEMAGNNNERLNEAKWQWG